MSLTIVTDTDVAALDYSNPPVASFRLDNKNKGPFTAMIPLSHLLDATKEKDCIKALTAQIAAIPYSQMRDIFLQVDGASYAVNAMAHATDHQLNVRVSRKMLQDANTNPPPHEATAIAAELQRHFRMNNVRTLEEAISSKARDNGIDEDTAAIRLREQLSRMNPPVIEEVSSYRARMEAQPETQACLRDVKAKTLAAFTASLAPAQAQTVTAMLKEPEDAQYYSRIAEALRTALIESTPAQKEAFITTLGPFIKTYDLPPPRGSLKNLQVNVFEGTPLLYKLEQVKAAHAALTDPAKAAAEAYAQLKAEAQRQNAKPGHRVKAIIPDVEKALADCPPHIRSSAEAMALKIVAVDDNVNINHIIPNNAGLLLLSTLAGGSTGQGIYVKQSMLKNPATLKEEIIHEVERHAVQNTNGNFTSFSLEPGWQKAIALDTAQAPANPQAAYIMRNPITIDNAQKVNAAVSLTAPPLSPGDPKKFLPFVEAIPDLYHYADAAKKELATGRPIRIGGNRLGFGGTKYTSVDSFMRAAFPNAWPMLEGAAPGMQLAQHPDGRVGERPRSAALPAGAEKTNSLKDYCEGAIQHAHEAAAGLSTVHTARLYSARTMPSLVPTLRI